MKKLLLIFLVSLVSCKKPTPPPLQEFERASKPRDPMTIVVALEENVQWGYYQFIRDGEFVGLEIDLLNHIDKHSDYRIVYIERPWKRAMKEVQEGSIDLLISATASPVRDATFDYTDEVYRINQVLYYDKDRFPEGFNFRSQSEIGQYRTGSILGYNIDQIEFRITDDGFTHFHGMAAAVKKGWIDFAVGYLELESFNKNMPENFDHLLIPDHAPLTCHWLVSKENPRKKEILNELNSGLKDLKESGHYQVLEQSYINQ